MALQNCNKWYIVLYLRYWKWKQLENHIIFIIFSCFHAFVTIVIYISFRRYSRIRNLSNTTSHTISIIISGLAHESPRLFHFRTHNTRLLISLIVPVFRMYRLFIKFLVLLHKHSLNVLCLSLSLFSFFMKYCWIFCLIVCLLSNICFCLYKRKLEIVFTPPPRVFLFLFTFSYNVIRG